MSVARQSSRLPQIATGPFAGRSTTARDGDWCEIEALLASTEPVSGGRRTSRALGRSLAGIAALIATGGLALAGLVAAERASHPGQAARKPEMASTIMAAPPRTQVANAPRAAIEEGRSVAAATPALPPPALRRTSPL